MLFCNMYKTVTSDCLSPISNTIVKHFAVLSNLVMAFWLAPHFLSLALNMCLPKCPIKELLERKGTLCCLASKLAFPNILLVLDLEI